MSDAFFVSRYRKERSHIARPFFFCSENKEQTRFFDVFTGVSDGKFGKEEIFGGSKMWEMLWPLLLIVGSNCFYNICTKSMPKGANTFGALTITYLAAGVLSAVLFAASVKPSAYVHELGKANWTSYVLGLSIVGIEVGYVFLYRSGWKVSNGALTSSMCLSLALLVIGFLVYREHISIKQLAGILVCGLGLLLINKG